MYLGVWRSIEWVFNWIIPWLIRRSLRNFWVGRCHSNQINRTIAVFSFGIPLWSVENSPHLSRCLEFIFRFKLFVSCASTGFEPLLKSLNSFNKSFILFFLLLELRVQSLFVDLEFIPWLLKKRKLLDESLDKLIFVHIVVLLHELSDYWSLVIFGWFHDVRLPLLLSADAAKTYESN
jgi:hypothetical protein